MIIRRSFTAHRFTSLVLVIWFLVAAVASPARVDAKSTSATTIQSLEEAVMPSVDPRSEIQESQGLQVLGSPFSELEISNTQAVVTFRRGMSVSVTASNPFYVNPTINAP